MCINIGFSNTFKVPYLHSIIYCVCDHLSLQTQELEVGRIAGCTKRHEALPSFVTLRKTVLQLEGSFFAVQ